METGMMKVETGEFLKAQNSYQKALELWRQSGNLNDRRKCSITWVFYIISMGIMNGLADAGTGLLCAREGVINMEKL